MNQDEIIEMARQVRFGTPLTHDGELGHFINGADYLEELVAFAKLVAAKATASEREAIAELESQDGACQHCAGKGCVTCDARKQEPVGWIDGKGNMLCVKINESCRPLYTHPLQRTWQKLTDEEIQAVLDKPEPFYNTMFWFARTIERKLKEKNHG